ncbi:DNA sulfur modification protein DndD [Winogradskyella luteola]|uniref:DNA sulfur modification protein DndD n=1 Tax=Winogradskyella luteola TaxID=2828330 RepID=A0A9X1FA79_9FLAO|nr:DNA sulfur modification protein DndD [Winogradskyella luteola]MBV7270150.1 DNA sulfur modification protein DndD [Winogradskyella luteola]
MRIDRITLENFRIYKGLNEIDLSPKKDKNISLIAGKNGFGKTTFLTSLIWCFYGKLMSQVEDKYKQDIRNSGGYEAYVNSLLNRDVLGEGVDNNKMSVEIELEDLLIPSIPCKTVTIKRTYDFSSLEETVTILIDGDENELTKSVGYEVFINDFILPREIAKFFFFDAEKIVSLAEAKSKSELRSLSKAYSEVLGIKKYEELKKNLESLLVKLKRRGVSELQQEKLTQLLNDESELEKEISHNQDKQVDIDKQLVLLKSKSDSLQEKLIREGNSITLDELKELKSRRDDLKQDSIQIKNNLKKLLDLTPLVIAGKHLNKLKEQLDSESNVLYGALNDKLLSKELEAFSNSILKSLQALDLEKTIDSKVKKAIKKSLEDKLNSSRSDVSGKVLLEFAEERYREFEAILNNIKSTFLSQFNAIVKEERTNRALLSRTINKIKQAEARKDNHLARQFRDEKSETDTSINKFLKEKDKLNEGLGALKLKLSSHKKVRVEYEKNFNLVETDKKKYEVTKVLLEKINNLIVKIKEEKKYSLQKSVSLGLSKLMHKKDFITNVKVNIVDDVMDIDLLDKDNNVIDKDSLSKGEQQLYATALLKALVDESGIRFPVFIDSPLQKFDKFHSKNIIQEFYPSISEQVVLFPLLEKELSEKEYELLKPNLSKTFLIQNKLGASTLKALPVNSLFKEFKKEKDVYTY